MSRVRISNKPGDEGWRQEGYSRPYVIRGYGGTLVQGDADAPAIMSRKKRPSEIKKTDAERAREYHAANREKVLARRRARYHANESAAIRRSRMKQMLVAAIAALALALPVSVAASEPLTLVVYPGCSGPRGTLWEAESDRAGRVDVSFTPFFGRRTTRTIQVVAGDTFFWTRSTNVYVREHGGTTVVTATANGDQC